MNDEVLKVAVVGGGPAGMYVAAALLEACQPVTVDILDRLPTPYGLLRYGVAPDHQKMKSLQKTLQRTLADERVRFVGAVEVGTTVTIADLRSHYHAVVYTFGASADRHLDIPGEDLPGVASATEFVNWYSGHPDVPADRFTLDMTSAVVVGVGNVAVDVARILLKRVPDLEHTDIPQPVLDRLAESRITDVHILGRRGPVQAKYTTKEFTELGRLDGVDVLVDPGHLVLDPRSATMLEQAGKGIVANHRVLHEWSLRGLVGAPRRLHLHYWTRPTRLVGPKHLREVVTQRTQFDETGRLLTLDGELHIPARLLLRSVGYRGVAVPGVPLDDSGVVPNDGGRVLRDGVTSPGEYAAGWIGRGPVGILGTNRRDAKGVVERMATDRPMLMTRPVVKEDLINRLQLAGLVVDKQGWQRIDVAEQELGEDHGRERTKLADVSELLAAARDPEHWP